MKLFNTLKAQAQEMRTPENKVFAVSGSPRLGGNSDVVIQHILKGVSEKRIESKKINLSNVDFQGCIGCEVCRKDKICTRLHDGMSLLYPEIMLSKGLVLVSPVHQYNITSWMKAFIDRLYCFYEFDNATRPRAWSSRLAHQHRKVVLAVICEQSDPKDMGFAMEALQRPMEALGYEVVGRLPIFKAFEKGIVKHHTEVLEQAYQMGIELGDAIQ